MNNGCFCAFGGSVAGVESAQATGQRRHRIRTEACWSGPEVEVALAVHASQSAGSSRYFVGLKVFLADPVPPEPQSSGFSVPPGRQQGSWWFQVRALAPAGRKTCWIVALLGLTGNEFFIFPIKSLTWQHGSNTYQ